MARYRKKPVEVEVRRLPSGSMVDPDIRAIAAWCGGEVIDHFERGVGIEVVTANGNRARAYAGDWIIPEPGYTDRAYPCAPDIFEQTYEAV